MEKQIFLSDIRYHFNLRKPNKDKATNIYLVLYFNGKQIKLPTGLKVNPYYWNKDKEEAYISFKISKSDNDNNKIVNIRIREIKDSFDKFKAYICDNHNLVDNIKPIIRRFIYNKENIIDKKASSLLFEAFKRAYPNQESGTYKANYYRLNNFIRYYRENGFEDVVNVVLTQNMLDKYKNYLINKQENGVQNINDRCEIVKRLINGILAVNEEYKIYGINKVEYIKIKDKRKKEDSKKSPLTDEEVNKLAKLKLYGKEEEIRDIFLLLVYCGMRISDIESVVNAPINLDNDNEEEHIILTKKESVEAVITFNRQMKMILRKYRKGFKYINISKVNNIIDATIKIIAKKANLKRRIQWKEQFGDNTVIQKEKPLYEIISSHFARHTFITNKIIEGWQADKLCFATGHTDDKMIKQIYTHLSDKNKINIVLEEKNRIKKKNASK